MIGDPRDTEQHTYSDITGWRSVGPGPGSVLYEQEPWVTIDRLQHDRDALIEVCKIAAKALEPYAEAECVGDPPTMQPNRAMRALEQVREALGENGRGLGAKGGGVMA